MWLRSILHLGVAAPLDFGLYVRRDTGGVKVLESVGLFGNHLLNGCLRAGLLFLFSVVLFAFPVLFFFHILLVDGSSVFVLFILMTIWLIAVILVVTVVRVGLITTYKILTVLGFVSTHAGERTRNIRNTLVLIQIMVFG